MNTLKLVVRFLLGGIPSTVISLGGYGLLNEIAGLWYPASAGISFSAAVVVSFLIQRQWVFRTQSTSRELVQLFFLRMSLALADAPLIYAAVEWGGMGKYTGLAVLSVLFPVNFVGSRRIFHKTSVSEQLRMGTAWVRHAVFLSTSVVALNLAPILISIRRAP